MKPQLPCMAALVALAAAAPPLLAGEPAPARPNILWITCEDLSPDMVGCFGNPQATTPHLDRLAGRGTRYLQAFTAAPVCSPSRSGLILGMVAGSTGSQNLRSRYGLPERFHGFPHWLRQAGYYCTNNVKTDYNTAAEKRLIAECWNESSRKAHWRGRSPGQPFFAVFNIETTHQSKGGFIDPARWDRPLAPGMHDPAKVRVPPFYPDTPTVRRTLANYYDKTTEMDARAGQILGELEGDGLADATIVFFYGDHGTGLPRGKRTLYDSGLQVPLIVAVPPRFRPFQPGPAGGTLDRLVSFIDFGPTLLSLAGLPTPGPMQGRAFLGPHAGPARPFVHGARDRVDEAFDLARSVRDGRYLYIRHFAPHVSWNAPEWYSDQAPMRREITRLARGGKLNAAQRTYAGQSKPIEELFDSRSDPYQVHNLAADPARQATLVRMRAELRRWILDIRDTGFMPEEHLERVTGEGGTPWALARDEKAYPLARVLDVAGLVGQPEAVARQTALLDDPLPVIRYWAVQGLAAAGDEARGALPRLAAALSDADPAVRIVAAGAVLGLERSPRALEVLSAEMRGAGISAVRAARTLEMLGEGARPALAAMRTVLQGKPPQDVAFALQGALVRLGEAAGP